MKNKIFIFLAIYILTSSVLASANIPYRDKNFLGGPISNILPEKQNNFQMNHSFSIATSTSKYSTSTSGTYSNFSDYLLSDRIILSTGFHLTQTKNNLLTNGRKETNFSFDFGLEYKMSKNILFNVIIRNNSSSFNRTQSFSSFYAPKK